MSLTGEMIREFERSLEKDNPMVYQQIATPAIRTIEKFSGKHFTYWAWKLFLKRK